MHVAVTWLALVFLFLFTPVYAHESIEHTDVIDEATHFVHPVFVVMIASAIILLAALKSIYFGQHLGDRGKKFLFYMIAVPALLATFYLAIATVYENVSSETGGPVHWHADFEVWACGEKLQIIESHGLENKVGDAEFHHHNDYRIHVEGVMKKKSEAGLGAFFKVIGGSLTKDTMTVPMKDGNLKTWKNGDLCQNGVAGKVKLFVKEWQSGQFFENPQIEDYVLKPYGTVPPGDYLLIKFE